jgi:hypothetical protein
MSVTFMEETQLAPAADNHLFRQVRDSDYQNGTLSSLAFRPMPKDKGELSVDVERLVINQQPVYTSAQQSYTSFKANGGGRNSVGVWAVTTQECSDHGLTAYHQPKLDPPPNPVHGYVDFKPLPEKDWRKKGARLAECAMKRGCVHSPAPVPPQSPPTAPTGETPPPSP